MRIKLSPSNSNDDLLISGVELIHKNRSFEDYDLVLDAENSEKLLVAIAPFALMENSNETD